MTEADIVAHEARAAEPRLCVACRWLRKGRNVAHFCGRAEDFVIGGPLQPPCYEERYSDQSWRCGPDGKLWEPRDAC